VLLAGLVTVRSAGTTAQTAPTASRSSISEADLREWVTYLASDALEGREVFTEGYALAAAYVADHLREWGVTPLGDNGSYFQSVKRLGYKVTRNSSVTIDINGQSRTFRDGDHLTLPIDAGGAQRLIFTDIAFGGYGIVAANGDRPYSDFSGKDVATKLVVFVPGQPDRVSAPISRGQPGRGTANRATPIVTQLGAAATIEFLPASSRAMRPDPDDDEAEPPAQGTRARRAAPDLTTVADVTRPTAPTAGGDETFFEFLFRGASMPFAEVRRLIERGEPLPALTWANTRVTINVQNTYDVIAADFTRNVVGMVEGTDPALKDTYVFVGAHLDHVGVARTNEAPPGRVVNSLAEDRIWNGADDDGTGSSALLAMAKAFALGERTKRSMVFVWHAGEEARLLGSRYMTEFPVVPLDRVQAQLNIDMIGRNRDDRSDQANTVYVIGADRISTDLHNLMIETNAALAEPLTIDFEFNDPNDPNSFYTRSDHYSYALKGIPIAFFFTGTHEDYHANSDTVDKILFPKLVRVANLTLELARRLGDRAEPLEHDNRGPRAGSGFRGSLVK
jgi:hypothetical protein